MTVWIDQLVNHTKVKPKAIRYGNEWCHLFADSLGELHEFARRIGLKSDYFQPDIIPHYNLTPAKRMRSLEYGAVQVSTKEFVRYWLAKKNE